MSAVTSPGSWRYAGAERLDHRLGDPAAPDNPFGFAAAVERDERAAFPEQFSAELHEAGVQLTCLPRALGGRLDGFDQTLALIRVAARRDLNVMPATMLSISAIMAVLVHGSGDQQRRVAELLREGRTIAFALSEEHAGSELLANTCRLQADGDGYRLTGSKWLIGLGARCDALYLVARTGERGPNAFSSVLVERATLPSARVHVSAPARTTGMRGIDFASWRFDACPLPAHALVGAWGQGLEAAMKAQQVVRMLSAAGNLACADTALRVVLDFALQRTVQGIPLVDLPPVRRELALAAAGLFACDVAAIAAARGIHVGPAQFGLWSCALKRMATELSEELIGRCGGVLGARSVLCDGPTGIFQKMQRDNAIVRVIDTSPIGNLRSVAAQLPMLAAMARGAGSHDDPRLRARLEEIFTLDRTLPPFAPGALDLNARGRDDLSWGVRLIAVDVLAALRRTRSAAAADQAGALVAELVAELEAALAALATEVDQLKAATGAGFAASAQALELADRFCHLQAAAAAVHLWWFNRRGPLFGEAPGSVDWLTACLAFLLARSRGQDARAPVEATGIVDTALRLHSQGRLFSAVPIDLAGGERSRARTAQGPAMAIDDGSARERALWPGHSYAS